MTHPTPAHLPLSANGAGHPSQLTQDLDALMQRLNEIAPGDGFAQAATVGNPVPTKDPPRLWDRLKGVAQRLAHPAPAPEPVSTAQEGVRVRVNPLTEMPARAPSPPSVMLEHAQQGHSPDVSVAANVRASQDMVDSGATGALQELTMTSQEIADLTGKRHFHVLRDIELMLKALGLPQKGYIQSWLHPQNGQSYRQFVLPKDLTLTLVSGYRVVMRKRIIDRWLELERRAAMGAFGVPQTLQAALRMAADLLDENQTLRLENQTLKQRPDPAQASGVGRAGNGADVTDGKVLTISELARVIGTGRNRLFQFLRDDGLLLKAGPSYVPTEPAKHAGWFAFRTPPPSQRKTLPVAQLVVTKKGQRHIRHRLTELRLPPRTP